MTETGVDTSEQNNIITLGNNFDVVQTADGIEITRGSDKFAILCAKSSHPYCNYAEARFAAAAQDPTQRIDSDNREIQIYLRNTKTLRAETVKFRANISRKRKGVQSAIITAPAELAGLMCSPSIDGIGWIVFRPFNHKFYQDAPDGQTDLDAIKLSPHIKGFPKVETSPTSNSKRITPLPVLELENLAKKGIISAEEKSLFKSVQRLYLDEGFTTTNHKINIHPEEGSNNKFLLDTDGCQEIPATDERLFIFGRSSHQWAEIRDAADNCFSDTQPSSHGYTEFIAGHIISEEGKYYFITEEPPTSLEGLKSGIHRLKNVAHDIIREVQGSVHQNN